MAKTRPPYTPEFRRQMVELVRAGRSPEELAREFEPTAQSIKNWVGQAEGDAGRGDGGLTRPSLTAAARDGRTFVRPGTEEWLRPRPNQRIVSRRTTCRQIRYSDPKPSPLHETGASPDQGSVGNGGPFLLGNTLARHSACPSTVELPQARLRSSREARTRGVPLLCSPPSQAQRLP